MTDIPDKLYYKIGEVSRITDIKPYVLRYWESEFEVIRPQKTKTNQRVYTRKDVELILEIKRLIYNERFTLEGVRKRMKSLRKDSQLNLNFPDQRYLDTLKSIKDELSSIKSILSR